MPWKECHVMDERLRFVARLLEGDRLITALEIRLFHLEKWRLGNARPEPDLRYCSNLTASRSL